MEGGIYTRQRCPLCSTVLNHRLQDGIACQCHPEIRASRFIVKFKKTYLNFREFKEAERYILEADEGSYDPRDYRRDNPLGFSELMQ